MPPDHLAGAAVEAGNDPAATVVGAHEHDVAVHDRGGAEALVHHEVAHSALPQDLARGIESRRVDALAVREIDVEPLAIPGDRGSRW
jgi:hypothetical protein